MIRHKYYVYFTIILVIGLILQYLRVIDITGLFGISNIYDEQFSKELPVSADIPEEAELNTLYLLFSSSDTQEERQVYENLRHICRNAKIPTEAIDISQIESYTLVENIPSRSQIVIATEAIGGKPEQFQNLLYKKTKEGSYITFAIRGFHPYLNDLVGIQGLAEYVQGQMGMNMEKSIFPGLDSVEREITLIQHSSLDAEVSTDADVIGRSSDGLPLIWTMSRGKGQILYANTSMFQDKVNRGLLLQLINYNADVSRSTMINAAIFNIDDFPAPIPLGKNPKIFEDYQRDTIKFYKEIWWSDVRLLLEKYNLKPSGFIIGIYNDDTEAPLQELIDYDRETISYFGRKLSEAGGVMGIHGYNHNPLALEGEIRFEDYGYSPWSSKEDMTASLEYLKKTIQELFGDVNPKSYVAPSNLISKAGMEAVLEAFPEIEVFAGLYTSPSEPGLFLQEFGPNPEFEQIYNTPRISSGYINSKETMWNIFNGIAEFGIFNHYIHPDDLLDPDRSKGMNWQNMKIDFERILRSTFRKFPFLRGYNNYEAYLRFKQYDRMRVDTWRKDSGEGGTLYTIAHRDAVMPVFHYFRTSRDITSITGGKLNPLPREGLYVIEATEPLVEIELK